MDEMIYEFYYCDASFLMEIEADREAVERLLNEYRESDPEGYSDYGWLEFLEKRGIKARILDAEHSIYF